MTEDGDQKGGDNRMAWNQIMLSLAKSLNFIISALCCGLSSSKLMLKFDFNHTKLGDESCVSSDPLVQ
jgi:hypothetical protein